MKNSLFNSMSIIHKLFILFLIVITWSSCSTLPELPAPTELICEYQQNPIGIDQDHPQLSWKLPASEKGLMQSAYEILVATSMENLDKHVGDVWATGKVDSDQSAFIDFTGNKLNSRQKYFWKVKYWDNKGAESEFSEAASWEMALLNNSDWTAKWITRTDTKSRDDSLRSFSARKEFNIDQSIKKARLYVTGLGNYVFYINGEKVGNDILTPGWTHYPKRVQYQVYDITSMLLDGGNAAGAMLGNAWWSGGLGWGKDPNSRKRYSYGPMKVIAQIEIEDESGNIQILTTDDSWKWSESPITFNNLYDGVHYDARLEQDGWNKKGFDESSWKNAATIETDHASLVAQQAPPLRVESELLAQSITQVPNGNYVFDFGQNMVGWGKLKVSGEAGTTIKLKFAELLHEDGTVAQENLRSAIAIDEYTLKGEGTETWEPQFTYSGFRYVEIEGFPGEPTKDALTGIVFYSSAPWIGKFESSNELMNNIIKNITWGQRGNMHSVPTDCPQRDERLGWMGDAQTFGPTSCYNMDMTQFYEKWLFDITDSQDSSGYVYDVNPAIVVSGPSKPGWGDAVIIVPWVAYKFSGNERILSNNYEGMKAWVEFMRKHAVNNIYTWSNPDSTFFGYADWIAPVKSPQKPISASFLFYSSKILSEIATVLGNTADAEEYAKLAKDVADAYQDKYFDQDVQNYDGETQTANLLPLAFGITPDELKPAVLDNILKAVKHRNGHPSTGFLGTQFILPILSDYGHHEKAYEMINLKTYPSWGYMIDKGATTMWELWNSDTERPEGMNSRNHYALGGIGEWIYGYLAGLKPDVAFPGYKRSIIAPMPVGDLTWAKASQKTSYGELSVDWKIEGEGLILKVVIPANTSSLVKIPKTNLNISAILVDGVEVYNNGKSSGKIDGLKFLSENENSIDFEVGSGDYAFVVK